LRIRRGQARLHVVAEAAAVLLVVPFMGFVATRKELPTWTRWTAAGIGVGTLVVDGFLLTRFLQRPSALGDLIPGGRAAGRKPREFDPKQLRVGIKIEREHTRSNAVAKEIAMDHLAEDPRYYTKLCWIHDEPPCRLL
jgi:hypothetical protein